MTNEENILESQSSYNYIQLIGNNNKSSILGVRTGKSLLLKCFDPKFEEKIITEEIVAENNKILNTNSNIHSSNAIKLESIQQ